MTLAKKLRTAISKNECRRDTVCYMLRGRHLAEGRSIGKCHRFLSFMFAVHLVLLSFIFLDSPALVTSLR